MKRPVRIIPAVLSLIVLAAHFLRMQNVFLVAVSLALVPLLFSKRQWGRRAVRIFLILGSVEWVRTTLMLVMERKALGLPFVRAVIILGSVTLLTMSSALLAGPGKKSPCNERNAS